MKVVPLYATRGDVGAYLSYPHIYNVLGEWIDICTRERELYSVLCTDVGCLSDGQRILPQRGGWTSRQRQHPPARPTRLAAPATVPRALTMRERELTHSTVDARLEEFELLHTADTVQLRPDME